MWSSLRVFCALRRSSSRDGAWRRVYRETKGERARRRKSADARVTRSCACLFLSTEVRSRSLRIPAARLYVNFEGVESSSLLRGNFVERKKNIYIYPKYICHDSRNRATLRAEKNYTFFNRNVTDTSLFEVMHKIFSHHCLSNGPSNFRRIVKYS